MYGPFSTSGEYYAYIAEKNTKTFATVHQTHSEKVRNKSKTPPASTNDGKKNFHRDTTTTPPIEIPSTNAPTEPEQLMFQALKQLQEIYDTSCKTKPVKITIERATKIIFRITKLFKARVSWVKGVIISR
jgi:hypothetical protein